MRTKNSGLDEAVKYSTGSKAICKHCHRDIVFSDPLDNGYDEWHLPDLLGKGPWWECPSHPSEDCLSRIHNPEEKESSFDKLYKTLKS